MVRGDISPFAFILYLVAVCPATSSVESVHQDDDEALGLWLGRRDGKSQGWFGITRRSISAYLRRSIPFFFFFTSFDPVWNPSRTQYQSRGTEDLRANVETLRYHSPCPHLFPNLKTY